MLPQDFKTVPQLSTSEERRRKERRRGGEEGGGEGGRREGRRGGRGGEEGGERTHKNDHIMYTQPQVPMGAVYRVFVVCCLGCN